MKVLKTPTMKDLLKRGVRKAKKMRKPSDGMMFGLFTHEKKNGWYYQVDFIYDTRCNEHPYVAVFGFKPPRVYHAKSAEYVLTQDIK